MNDTRAKLETLFRRLTDPAVSDLDALNDFVWFRKLRLDAKAVQEALGVPTAAPEPDSTAAPAPAPAGGTDDGPIWPFGKWKGVALSTLAKTDPGYLRFFLAKEGKDSLREPLQSQVRAALGVPAPAPAKSSDDFENP